MKRRRKKTQGGKEGNTSRDGDGESDKKVTKNSGSMSDSAMASQDYPKLTPLH